MLQDIAVLTGGTVISEEQGRKLEDATMEDLGRAESITIDKDNTTIVGGAGNKEAIQGRIAQIKADYLAMGGERSNAAYGYVAKASTKV